MKKKEFSNKKQNIIDKFQHLIITIIRISLLFAIIGGILGERWVVFFVSISTLILTYAPKLFEKKYKINLPLEFEIFTILFIYASLFLGEVHGYYTKFWWWDILLHMGSAIAFGFIGFSILFILYKGDRLNAKPITISIFTFFFAIGIGAIWEIFEFGMDQIFNLNMQKSGLIDTMGDLIIDSIGGLIASISGYFYIKKKESFLFNKVIYKFEKENPKMFLKK